MADPCDYFDFGAPFDDSDADIILRSLPASPEPGRTSATHFRVHRLFLIKASPVFKRFLCEATPSQYPDQDEESGITRDNYDNLPVLCLLEDTDTLRSLLTAIYPTDVAYPRTLEAMMKAHAAAKKYGMSSALTLFRTCVAPVVTTKNAFQAFFLAFNTGLKEEALEAARLSLSLPLTFESLGEELYNASRPALEALRRHRETVTQAIVKSVLAYEINFEDVRGWTLHHDGSTSGCTELEPRTLRPITEQIKFFVAKVVANISMMNIYSFIETMPPQGGLRCNSCNTKLQFDFRGLFTCLERPVDDGIEEVSPAYLDL